MVLTLGLCFLILLKRWHNTVFMYFLEKIVREKTWLREERRGGYEWADDGIKLPLSERFTFIRTTELFCVPPSITYYLPSGRPQREPRALERTLVVTAGELEDRVWSNDQTEELREIKQFVQCHTSCSCLGQGGLAQGPASFLDTYSAAE